MRALPSDPLPLAFVTLLFSGSAQSENSAESSSDTAATRVQVGQRAEERKEEAEESFIQANAVNEEEKEEEEEGDSCIKRKHSNVHTNDAVGGWGAELIHHFEVGLVVRVGLKWW
jgi:hypothetical protein